MITDDNITSTVKDVNRYFVDKLLDFDFEGLYKNETFLSVIINDVYEFCFYIGGGAFNFHTITGYSGTRSFLALEFTDEEKRKLYDWFVRIKILEDN